MVDTFLSRVETYIGVERDILNLEAKWEANNPVGTKERLTEYFREVIYIH